MPGRAAAVGLALVVLVTTGLAACTRDEATRTPGTDAPATTRIALPAKAPDVMRIGVVSRSTLDPAAVLPTNQSELITADLLFESLTSINPKSGAAAPGIAWTWAADQSQTVWRFELREGAKFSNGNRVTPADVKSSLERVTKQSSDECARQGGDNGPAGRCPSLAGLRLEVIDGFREFVDGNATDIRGLKPIDDKIIEIDTREPFAPLPELLASPAFGIVPKDTGSSAELDKSPVTSGPYELTGRDGEVWHLRKTRSTPSPTPVDRIDLVRFASTPDSYGAFVDGKLDWSLVPADKVADATATYGTGAVTPFTIEQFFGMNMGSPTFANEKFRQAIAKAVDRKALIDAAIPGRPVLNGAVPPGVPGVVDDACAAACQSDPDAARKLLAEAFPDGKVPPLEIATYDDPTQKKLAEGLRDQLKAVGIDASVAVKAVEEYAKYLVSGQQQLFALGWVGLYPDPDAYLAPLFLSSSLDNVTGYSSPDLDGALKEARGVSDRSARIARYADMQRSVMAQLPIIPLAATDTNAVVAKRVQGYQGRLDGTFDIDSLELAG